MNTTTRTALTLAAASLAGIAAAEPVDGGYFDQPTCDNHGPQTFQEEFGDPSIFAPDEAFAHAATFTNLSACTATDSPSIPNALVQITNLTGRFLEDLYYVADEGTTFSNIDGGAFGAGSPSVRTPAFRRVASIVSKPAMPWWPKPTSAKRAVRKSASMSSAVACFPASWAQVPRGYRT